MSRRHAREGVLKTLFQTEFQDNPPKEAPPLILEDLDVNDNDIAFARKLLAGVLTHRDEIDGILESFAKDWSMDRIARLERSILRMALYELVWFDDIPPAVTLDEAVELTKAYCAPEAAPFINGILGNIQKHLNVLKEQNASDRGGASRS